MNLRERLSSVLSKHQEEKRAKEEEVQRKMRQNTSIWEEHKPQVPTNPYEVDHVTVYDRSILDEAIDLPITTPLTIMFDHENRIIQLQAEEMEPIVIVFDVEHKMPRYQICCELLILGEQKRLSGNDVLSTDELCDIYEKHSNVPIERLRLLRFVAELNTKIKRAAEKDKTELSVQFVSVIGEGKRNTMGYRFSVKRNGKT